MTSPIAADKTPDEHFRDWESHAFGFGYGTGEPHTLAALKTFLAAIPERPYNYEVLERACGATVAWLLINALCRPSHKCVMEEDTNTSLSEARALIDASGMSVERLAKLSGISRATLYRWKNRDDFIPNGRALERLRRVCAGDPPKEHPRPEGAALIMHQMPNGKVRLQINKVVDMAKALRILAELEGGE